VPKSLKTRQRRTVLGIDLKPETGVAGTNNPYRVKLDFLLHDSS
jgi:hypothetical protein